MTPRLVQQGRGSPRPLLIVYHLGEAADESIRRAVGPNATIINYTAPGGAHADYSGAPDIQTTIADAAKLAATSDFGPIVLAGFSAGGIATRFVLDHTAALHQKMPDALVIADGTYGSSAPKAWIDFTNDARAKKSVMIASHTSLVVPTSTWHVLQELTGWDLPLGAHVANRPSGVPVLKPPFERRQAGNLIVYSYPTDDGNGHMEQGRTVLPKMLNEAASMLDGKSSTGPIFGLAALGLAIGVAVAVARR